MTPTSLPKGKSSEFHMIMSCMRSGSSLFGHILSETNQARYAGEIHQRYSLPRHFFRAKMKILFHCNKPFRRIPVCDKVLHPYLLPQDFSLLTANVDRFYFLLRHPLAILRSYDEVQWESGNAQYLLNQLKKMHALLEVLPQEKIIFATYYDITNPTWQEKVFGQEVSTYKTLPKTGLPSWGDPEKNISSGVVLGPTLEQDIERALKTARHWLQKPIFKEIMEEYRKILTLVDAQKYDIPLP